MSGVTLSDLSKYHQGAIKWFKDGLVSEHNRLFAQTGEAGAVSFWPLGGTPLEGKVKFSFKETPPASGDKGPENPSTITGVSSINVTRCGKNLLRFPYYWDTYNNAGIYYTANQDGTVLVNGTSTSNAWFSVLDTPPWENVSLSKLRLVSGNPYTASLKKISGSISGNSINLQIMNQFVGHTGLNPNVSLSDTVDYSYGSINWSSSRNSEKEVKARFGIWPNAVCNNLVVAPQLEYGNQATEYEPYIGDDYTIQLGNTYYGGEIDLVTGVMTVTHKKVRGVVGSTIQLSGDFVRVTLATSEAIKNDNSQLLCNMLPTSTDTTIERVNTRGGDEFWSINCYINKSRLDLSSAVDSSNPTTAELKSAITAWLANNQLEFVYKRTKPTTVQLTPLQLTALTQNDKYTPRINTVYTDADSIQIRYRKSLIHDEDEKVQAIVALGGNV